MAKKQVAKKVAVQKSTATKKVSKKSSLGKVLKKPGKQPESGRDKERILISSWCVPTRDRPYLIERILTSDEVAAEYQLRQQELDEEFKGARVALDKWAPELRETVAYKRGDITGMCVRFGTKYGQFVSPLRAVIAINVATKYRLDELSRMGIEPLRPCYDGVPVKVLEGRFELLSPPTVSLVHATLTEPKNPLGFAETIVGGIPIAPPGQSTKFGTLGVVQSVPGGWLGLTCQHVVGAQGATVEQLGPPIAGTPSVRPLGTVSKAFNDDFTTPSGVVETLDCAAVKIDQTPSMVLPALPGGFIRDVNSGTQTRLVYATTRVNQGHVSREVWKFGAATGALRIGTVVDFDRLELTLPSGRKTKNNFTVKAPSNNHFVEDGDSGSLLALKVQIGGQPAFLAIGILFARLAGSENVGVGCNMCEVLRALSPGIS